MCKNFFFFIFDGAGVDDVHAKDAGQEAGDSKWEIARCCYMKGFYIFFDMAASSYSPLRISSFGGRTTCSRSVSYTHLTLPTKRIV